jgi:molybdopterin-guanine dinucleotide biosynthesis protein A
MTSGPRREQRARCTGVVLAGGRALRLGGIAKGLEPVGTARMIDRAIDALAEAADDVVISANADDAVHWVPRLAVVRDAESGAGAIGGILAAIDATEGAVITVPWDMPFVPGSLLCALREAGEAADAEAVVPMRDNAWGVEPLVGWFSPWCAPVLASRLRAGDARAGAWLEDVRAIRFDCSPWGDPARLFFNVNTPDELTQAQRMIAEGS